MASLNSTRLHKGVGGPKRSRSAAHAHQTGAVTWTVDLEQRPADRTREQTAATRKRGFSGLVLMAAGLWAFNVGYVIAHIHTAFG